MTLRALPGNRPQPAPHRPLTDAMVEAAIAAVAALSDRAQGEELFGFLELPPFRTRWWAPSQTLGVIVDGRRYLSRSPALCVDWHFGIIEEREDWYEIGWLPCDQIYAMRPPWGGRLTRALNAPYRTVR